MKRVMGLAEEMISGETKSLPVHTVVFYPAERVHEIFARLEATRGIDKEAAELRIFAERMIWLYKTQREESNIFLDFTETCHFASCGEAALDAERTATLEAGNV